MKGRRLSPPDIGSSLQSAAVSFQSSEYPYRVISTGNELISVGDIQPAARYGTVQRDAGCLSPYGRFQGKSLWHCEDERELLRKVLHRALAENDAVILSGGSSKDERDLCAELIGECGEVLVHGVAIAPGKPTIIGRCMGKPVLGLPGHPASALVVLDRIGKPI